MAPSDGDNTAGFGLDPGATTGGPEAFEVPSIDLPKGGGAIRGIGERFGTNPVTGTASLELPLPLSPGRSGFAPEASLSYDSGSGNGPFGLGWALGLPAISRKTQAGLPRYEDATDSDTFVLSGAEDLVPAFGPDTDRGTHVVRRYRPRVESAFARIERWTRKADGDVHWRVTSANDVTTLYGVDAPSRIADPADPARVFKWLIASSYDGKGNAAVYEYRAEDSVGVLDAPQERNRTAGSRSANRYLKRIRYGNRVPNLNAAGLPTDPALLDDFMFEAVFDYGEGHLTEVPNPGGPRLVHGVVDAPAGAAWPVRPDAFSSYRAGFEIRTYRLCRRVLMFHRFPAELGVQACLVSAAELDYAEGPALTRLRSFTQTNFLRRPQPGDPDVYEAASHPALEIEYSDVPDPDALAQAPVQRAEVDGGGHLPFGVEGVSCHWLDLDGEGLAGVLIDHGDGWFYSRNRSAGPDTAMARLGAPEPVPTRVDASPGGATTHLIDWDGDGLPDLVQLGPNAWGVNTRAPDGSWAAFRPFTSAPQIDALDPDVRLADLDGDGRLDLLLTQEHALTWFLSTPDGFAPARHTPVAADEETGPRLVFHDERSSAYLADLSGDGLTDLVRIRNGEVSYWPNLGYGRFGARVTMDAAPVFAAPDEFDPRRVLLGDLDGSGTTDIAYAGSDGVRLYFNLAGNSWGAGHLLRQLATARSESLQLLDLLGTGCGCLVSTAAENGVESIRYVDLMAGGKPHLLTGYDNGTGRHTRIDYRPSTYFYLADMRAGTPWATRLPFPVHCVERTTVEDQVRETVFTSSYSYHHGYYDGPEREFRGFARVDQLDTDEFSRFELNASANVVEERLHQPPVRVRTWFHTGALSDGRLLHQLAGEYYANSVVPEPAPAEVRLPPGLTAEELREAVRACKGLPLRREVYALDGAPESEHPYLTTESSYSVHLAQARADNDYACLFTTRDSTITHQYERVPADPRVSQAFVLETDELGRTHKSVSISYGRRMADPGLPAAVTAAQRTDHLVYTETEHINDVLTADRYRLRVPYESRTYELTGMVPDATGFYASASLLAAAPAATEVAYEDVPGAGTARRLLTRSRIEFLADDLTAPLPVGTQGTLGLVSRMYQLAFTAGLAADVYGAMVDDAAFTAAGYVQLDGQNDWWLPSGAAVYAADAATRFYLPAAFRDALGTTTVISRDTDDLLVRSVTDALGNTAGVDNDYRVLAPSASTDINGNVTAVERDALGVVVKTAVMGKAGEADSLADPTMRIEYDLEAWRRNGRPNTVNTFSRELHGAANPRWQERYAYLDGSGAEVMIKAQARPGIAKRFDETTGTVQEVDATPQPRWLANGREIVNNKGSIVKRYEPYFAADAEYETARELVETGVTSVLFYDPLGRGTRVEHPNGTLARMEFGAWHQRRFDPNDTVLESTWYADRGSPDPTGPEPADPEQRAAWLAARHADTPAVVHADSLERSVYSVADNGTDGVRAARSEMDITAHRTRIFDARDRLIADSVSDLLGRTIAGESAERGQRLIFTDVLGAVRIVADDEGRVFRDTYDVLHRPVTAFLRDGAGPEIAVGHLVYGEQHPDAAGRNLRGRLHRSYDQAGVATVDEVDIEGNPSSVGRRLAIDYQQALDWSALVGLTDHGDIDAAAEPMLGADAFTGTASFDALGRPIEVELPDGGTVIRPHFDEGNVLVLLEARLLGEQTFTTFLADQDRDARGRRLLATYGNGLETRYAHDALSLRLTSLITKRPNDADTDARQALRYTYDPVGNITALADAAQPTMFFDNAVVDAGSTYEYDALYELVRATGREHAAGNLGQRDHNDVAAEPLPHPNDAAAVCRYTETYSYDELGNLLRLRHTANGGGGWTRHYRYAFDEDPTDRTNRLIATSVPGDAEAGPFSATYTYDAHGHMTVMPHLASLTWDFRDLLHSVDLGGGGTAYYVAGSSGQRIRKVIERIGGTRIERIQLGPVELYRQWSAAGVLVLERRTTHLGDDTGVIAQVDTKTIDVAGTDPAPLDDPLIRYRYTDHLQSTTLETDETGQPISHEQYHPFGTTAYRSSRPGFDLSLKCYRYIGRERDNETGLYCAGVRYYAPWLGRWTSSDPIGFADGTNLYVYARNNPVAMSDPSGAQAADEVLVREQHFTGRETFAELAQAARGIAGWKLDPTLTPENYHTRYRPGPEAGGAGGSWSILVGDAGADGGEGEGAGGDGADSAVGEGAGDGTGATSSGAGDGNGDGNGPGAGTSGTGASGGGTATVKTNPEGFTLEVPNNFDNEKIATYKERITTDRGVGHRSVGPDGSRTNDIRRANRGLRDGYEASLTGSKRPTGTQIDHTVELQHIIRTNNTVRPQDHRVQPSSLNQSQGAGARQTANRQIATGVAEDVPAGGIARSSDIGKLVNQPAFRTAMRGIGYTLMAAGPALTAWGASHIDNAGVRYTGYGAAAVEAIGSGTYAYGRIAMGGGVAGNVAGQAVMQVGSRLAMGAGGVAQAVMSGYMFVDDLQCGDYVAAGFDGLSALGGVALVAAAIIGAGPLAVGLAVAGIVTGIAAGIFHLGRAFDWW